MDDNPNQTAKETQDECRRRRKRLVDASVLALFFPGLAIAGLRQRHAAAAIAFALRGIAPFIAIWLANVGSWSAHLLVWAILSTQLALWGGEVALVAGAHRRGNEQTWRPGHATVWVALVLCLGALTAGGVPLKGYKVAAGSMEPSLTPRDRLIVHKGLSPMKGDIVVFQAPPASGRFAGEEWLSRIIATPGQTVEFVVADGSSFTVVDGIAMTVAPCVDEPKTSAARPVTYGQVGKCVREGEPFYTVYSGADAFAAVTLSDDEFYVASDNRDNSIDSRMIGPIRKDAIVGVVWGKYTWKPWAPPTYDAGRQPRLLRAQKQKP